MSSKEFTTFFLCQTIKKKKILIPRGKDIIIGRSRLTNIKDRRLSKNHLKVFVPKSSQNKIIVEHIGSNSSILNGNVIKRGFVGNLLPGEKIELLEGKHEFKLIMEKNESNSKAPPSKNHWSNGLLQSMNDPNMVWYQDDKICIIKDKYPKAKYHFLVLPKNDNLSSLKKLSDSHTELVRYMIDSAQSYVINEIAKNDVEIEFRCGFHAVPSMAQVHMHVISQDFVSLCLKTKKHWNSFNTPYFVDAVTVLNCITTDGTIPGTWENDAKKWLSEDVKCHKCPHKPKGMGIPFKQHLESHHNQ